MRRVGLAQYSFLYVPADTEDPDVCAYCGFPADSHDHVPAISLVAKWGADYYIEQGVEFLLYPACRECNSVLAGFAGNSLSERCIFLTQHYEEKYKHIVNMPYWSEKEIAEMGPKMRRYIRAGIRKKTEMMQRMRNLRRVECNLAGVEL